MKLTKIPNSCFPFFCFFQKNLRVENCRIEEKTPVVHDDASNCAWSRIEAKVYVFYEFCLEWPIGKKMADQSNVSAGFGGTLAWPDL